ncbi:bifunctional heptose 7-phosphate kinase/heptose 1-phosphate adenyltransferase [Aspergillus novofumigatus IBT 16806]|uniref:Ribokinase-like protein n=1 Tax=Aspergillus novofumigatus (strain IBT 16806) TaxID=1392255 RepID=A0A2I1CHG7_ASPN1|nr:Ribokinase-like protein [Aspergillus novofumigatus IBT 16806]PKX97066.1 Ribokinase-like protein [Aspergillus novofumigatus IBT 16806]
METCQTNNSADGETLVVVGDLILNQYVYGTVRRNAPEADIPVVEQEKTEYYPGGAANVAMNLVALGTAVILVGTVGDDAEGEHLLILLTSAKVDVSGVQILADRPTCHKTRIIGNGRHLVRLDREVVTPIGEEQQRAAVDSVRQCLLHARGMICSDYSKGFLCESFLRSVIHVAVSPDRKVIVDPKVGDCSRYAGVTVMMPNLDELRKLSGLAIVSSADTDAAARAVLAEVHPEALLVTCGADGMVLYESDGKSSTIPGKASTAREVSGAGDSAVAAFAWAYLVRRQP